MNSVPHCTEVTLRGGDNAGSLQGHLGLRANSDLSSHLRLKGLPFNVEICLECSHLIAPMWQQLETCVLKLQQIPYLPIKFLWTDHPETKNVKQIHGSGFTTRRISGVGAFPNQLELAKHGLQILQFWAEAPFVSQHLVCPGWKVRKQEKLTMQTENIHDVL